MRSFIATILSCLFASTALAGGLKPGDTEVLSWKKGVPATESSYAPAISKDGRFVAFASYEFELAGWTANGECQIVLHDRKKGSMSLASKSPLGVPANEGCYNVAISANGRYVVFQSSATNLAGSDFDKMSDIFRYDRIDDQVERVSYTHSLQVPDYSCGYAQVSATGRYVVFESKASNLVPEGSGGYSHIYLRDLKLDKIERISVGPGYAAGNNESHYPAVSDDGRFVVFQSVATNLGPAVGVSTYNIYARDRKKNVTTLVSRGHGGQVATSSSYTPRISGNGRYVAFCSRATNLVKKDKGSGSSTDLFVYDRKKDKMQEFVMKVGKKKFDAMATGVSSNGRYIVSQSSREIMSKERELVDTEWVVHLIDRKSGKVTLASVNSKGKQANDNAREPGIAGNGKYIVFSSGAKNLGKDKDDMGDVFIRRR